MEIPITCTERKMYEDIAYPKCCRKRCLLSKVKNDPGSIDKSVKLIHQCRLEMFGYSKKKKKKILYDVVKASCVEILPDSNYWKHNFIIGKFQVLQYSKEC